MKVRNASPSQKFKDPVCGMMVAPERAAGSVEHHGQTYYFCNRSCLERFSNTPDAFVQETPRPPAIRESTAGEYLCPMDPDVRTEKPGPCPKCGMALEPVQPGPITQYTCPMHPQIIRAEPGPCPICGMALEPRTIIGEEKNPELQAMSRRFWWSAALSAPILVLMFSDFLPSHALQQLLPGRAMSWFELILATPVVLWGGWPFFERAWRSIVNRSPNMFTLIGIGTGAAYGFSVAATIAPGIFPQSFRGPDGSVAVYFEPAAIITTLVLLGQVLELRARSRTSSAIRGLLALAPKTARRINQDNSETDVPLEQIQVGDVLRVRPGDHVPVDGSVIDGRSSIDESMITGESMPVDKKSGDKVTGGTLNTTGSLIIRAERVGGETLLSQIVRLVADAQRSRAPIQRLADRVSAWFVPSVIAAAAVTFIIWAAYGPEPRLAHALVNAVAVLIIACPCALGLATPMSIMVATGRGASAGVLVRNAEALERLEQVDTLIVDKTGTLTEGKPKVNAVVPSGDFYEEELLRLAASVERASEHPIAQAVVTAATERGIATVESADFRSETGGGVQAKVEGHQVLVGTLEFLRRSNVEPAELIERADRFRSEGNTVIFVAVDGRAAGLLAVGDSIKSTTPEAIEALTADGIKVVMLTGDHRTTAQGVAAKLGITDVEAEVLPAEKANTVRKFQTGGRVVAMAGDGVNDAPALAQADIGIAMGTGTDVAMESAGVTLLKGDLRGIVRARRLSRATMRNIRQNLFFAFIYNSVGIPIAAGVLYPIFGWLLSPVIASAAMTFSSVSVITNALRLRRASL